MVGGGAELRAAIEAVYEALAIAIDPAIAGALDDELPGVTPGDVARALEQAYAADSHLEPRALDPAVLASARDLTVRHRVA